MIIYKIMPGARIPALNLLNVPIRAYTEEVTVGIGKERKKY